jgi:hypothetical protein
MGNYGLDVRHGEYFTLAAAIPEQPKWHFKSEQTKKLSSVASSIVQPHLTDGLSNLNHI